jgi:hypothetical protein
MINYNHPATIYVCRHCRKRIESSDPEVCFFCGPICEECHTGTRPCPRQTNDSRHEKKGKKRERR